MQVAVDKFGRVVLPKLIRNRFGLEAGSELDIVENAGMIILKIIDERPPLEIHDGLLVFTGKAHGNLEDAISRDRGDRLQNFISDF